MPETPIRLIQQPCPKCGVPSRYVLTLPVLDDAVDLAWFCRDCRHEWPVRLHDARVRHDPDTD